MTNTKCNKKTTLPFNLQCSKSRFRLLFMTNFVYISMYTSQRELLSLIVSVAVNEHPALEQVNGVVLRLIH